MPSISHSTDLLKVLKPLHVRIGPNSASEMDFVPTLCVGAHMAASCRTSPCPGRTDFIDLAEALFRCYLDGGFSEAKYHMDLIGAGSLMQIEY